MKRDGRHLVGGAILMHSQLMFNECIARHSLCATMYSGIRRPEHEIDTAYLSIDEAGREEILPPSNELEEGSGGHQTASSFGALQHI